MPSKELLDAVSNAYLDYLRTKEIENFQAALKNLKNDLQEGEELTDFQVMGYQEIKTNDMNDQSNSYSYSETTPTSIHDLIYKGHTIESIDVYPNNISDKRTSISPPHKALKEAYAQVDPSGKEKQDRLISEENIKQQTIQKEAENRAKAEQEVKDRQAQKDAAIKEKCQSLLSEADVIAKHVNRIVNPNADQNSIKGTIHHAYIRQFKNNVTVELKKIGELLSAITENLGKYTQYERVHFPGMMGGWETKEYVHTDVQMNQIKWDTLEADFKKLNQALESPTLPSGIKKELTTLRDKIFVNKEETIRQNFETSSEPKYILK